MKSYKVIRCDREGCREVSHELIGEEPLSIRVDGNPYSVVMRTPGDELAHVAGFCLGEGLVDGFEDFATIGYCKDMDPNVVDVRLTPERREEVRDLLERRGFISQTSCGICGKELVEELRQKLTPVENNVQLGIGGIFGCTDKLLDHQVHYKRTRGAHAAMVLDPNLALLSFAEDVGRHNALDKAIGKLLLVGELDKAAVVVLSSRISYELVQKTARAGLPIIVSKSRPTALAVDLGKELNMTLACNARGGELTIYSGEERVVR